MALDLGELGIKITADLKDFRKGMSSATKKLEDMSREMRGIALGASAAFVGMGLAVGKLAGFASDAEENLNVLEVTFGDLTPQVQKFARGLSKATGRSSQEIEKLTADAGSLIKPMVGSAGAAANMASQMVKLATDVSSFKEKRTEDVFAAIRAGLIGSSEPLLAYGADVREAALQSFALSKGIKIATKDMTQGAKAALRLQLIMEQLKDSEDDAEETSQSFANVVKAVQGTFRDLGAQMGSTILPILASLGQKLLSVLNAFKNLKPEVLSFITKGLLVATVVTGIVAALATVAAAIGPVIVGFKALIGLGVVMKAGFIKAIPAILAVAGPILLIGVIITGLIAGIGALRIAWKSNLFEIRDVAKEVAKSIEEAFGTALSSTIDALRETSKTVSKFGATLIGFISGADADEVGAMLREIEKSSAGFFSEPAKNLRESADFLGKKGAEAANAIAGGTKSLGGGLRDAGSAFIASMQEGLKGLGLDIDLGKLLSAGGEGGDRLRAGELSPEQAKIERDKQKQQQKQLQKLKKLEELRLKIISDLHDRINAGLEDVEQSNLDRRIQISNDVINAQEAAAKAVKDAAKKTADAADQQSKAIGGQITSAFGKLGGLFNSIQQGAEAGGPIGAAIAAFVELAKNIQSFADFQAVAGQVFDEAVAAVKPLVDAIMPALSEVVMALGEALQAVGGVFKIIGPVIGQIARQILRPLIKQLQGFAEVIKAMQPIIAILAETFKAISSIFELTFAPVTENLVGALKVAANVIRFAAKTILFIFRPFIELFNAIVRFVGEAARKIGNAIVDIGFKDTGRAIREWGKRLKKSQINLDALNDALNKTESTARDTGEALCDESPSSSLCGVLDDASTDLKGTISEIGQELTNVPKGFKTALAQFEATDTGLSVGGAPPPANQGASEQGFNRTIIENMNVIAPDAQKFSEELGDIAQWQNFRDTGSPVSTANNPFLVPATGGATQ